MSPNGLFGPKRHETIGGSGLLEEFVSFVTFIMHLGVDTYAGYGEIYPYFPLAVKLTGP